jgi:glycosyltransferase involved in cell wall biosynthesis
VIEAMGSGLAIVVSDGPGNPEAIGDAGIVIGLGDVDGLAATLGELARDPAQLRRLGWSARRRVLETLTADSLRAGVAAAYDAALERR